MIDKRKISRNAVPISMIVALYLMVMLVKPGYAQSADDWRDWPMGDQFTIALAAFFPNLDTKVRLDATDGSTGTTIDFEQNLGMSDTETLPGLGLSWRFKKKHQLIIDRFQLNRSGSTIATSDISFGDETFQINFPVSSFFDTTVTTVGYSYSIIFDEKKELALSAGLSVQDIQFGLIGTGAAGAIEGDSGVTAPLPAFGLTGGYAFTDKWILRGGLGVFSFSLAISDEEELEGEIITAVVALQHNTFENVHFGLNYSYFDVYARFADRRRINSVGYQYHGPMLIFKYSF